ncbi:MAG: GntR family transcriptional regulator, partial [Mycobacterium sp.]|nr:GntR family transcriptional regulator [Mycobacterium sp.]
FWMTYQTPREDLLPFHEDETAAIHRRDPEAARAACVSRSYLMAQTMLAELSRRRVFTPADDASPVVPEPLGVISDAEAACGEPSLAL